MDLSGFHPLHLLFNSTIKEDLVKDPLVASICSRKEYCVPSRSSDPFEATQAVQVQLGQGVKLLLPQAQPKKRALSHIVMEMDTASIHRVKQQIQSRNTECQ